MNIKITAYNSTFSLVATKLCSKRQILLYLYCFHNECKFCCFCKNSSWLSIAHSIQFKTSIGMLSFRCGDLVDNAWFAIRLANALLQCISLNFYLFTFQNSQLLRRFIAFLLQFYNCFLL